MTTLAISRLLLMPMILITVCHYHVVKSLTGSIYDLLQSFVQHQAHLRGHREEAKGNKVTTMSSSTATASRQNLTQDQQYGGGEKEI